MESTLDPADIAPMFKSGMRKFASGVTLITSTYEGRRAGLVATAVNSVSMEPPTLLICVNQAASAFEIIESSGCFCVNVLTVASLELAGQFSSSQRRNERFQSGRWTELRTGAPVLDDAMASFDCEIVHRIPYSTHTIFLGEVRAVQVPDASRLPLVYMDRAFRNIAGLTPA